MAETLISPLRFTPPTLGDNPPSRRVGRPEAVREQLVVRGNPSALENRPANAIGRIPVAVIPSPPPTEAEHALPFDPDAIQREVESSVEYRALKQAGLIKENPLRDETKPAASPQHDSDAPNTNISITEQKVEVQIRQERRIELRAEQRQQQSEAPTRRSDPLALDLDGNGLQTSGVDSGVRFDIDADGHIDQTSFITGGDAFLAIDANGNGRIDDGRELFGDQNGDANGYLALARYDDNGDALIDRNDTVFQQLRLFTMNSDGSQQLRSLEEGGIASISVNYSNSAIALNEYDSIVQQSSFTRVDGSTGESGDLLLGYRTLV